jgi:hypothetical protein
MAFDIAKFREDFPEFSDVSRYPDAMLNFWAGLAAVMMIECRWGSAYEYGLELYVAHEAAIAARNAKTGQGGGTPGMGVGLQNSKSVGSTSTSYDTSSTAEKNAGWWNLTTYGQQFFRMSRMIGAGAIQL